MLDWAKLIDEFTNLNQLDRVRFVALFVTPIVLVITFWGTIRITRAQKVTDTIVECGRGFNDLMKSKWEIKNIRRPEGVENDDAWREQLADAARFFYGQFFSFQFSEFVAYRSGFISRYTFTLWMRSRRLQWNNRDKDEEPIHGVSYEQGWQHWLKDWHHGAQDEFTGFMTAIHRGPAEVRDIVGSHAPFFSVDRWSWWFGGFLPFRHHRI